MADTEKKAPGGQRISDQERFRYIGFEVFPGKPKDLFRNEAEKEKYVEQVQKKRQSDETLRDKCTLVEERIGTGERVVLILASLAILVALFLPWYSAYVEVAAAKPAQPEAAVAMSVEADQPDTLAEMVGDSINQTPQTETVETGIAGEEPPPATPGAMTHAGERANQQILTGHIARRALERKYSSLSGLGAVGALGVVGPDVFSSGFVLVVSGILMLILAVLCVALPVINIYGLFGLKGTPDERALKLKKLLRLNWLPLIVLFLVFFLSFFGAQYGFDAPGKFASLGDSYGIGTVFSTLSWGIFIAIAASVMVAAKGIEI
jgi:hypothetical protein